MRIDRIAETYDVDVEFTQFPLHPETPDEGSTLEELFAGRNFDLEAAHTRLAGLMKAEGLPYGTRTHTYNSRLAQELAKWAEVQPAGASIHDALFKAYFVDGINVADADRLVEIAGSLGLSPEDAREVIAERRMKSDVDRDWARAAELGVTGVPTFVVGDRSVVGAQPYEELEQLVTQAGAQRRGDSQESSR
ncbi:MAG: hypothetical protein E2P02_31375 [Acidobacteria bacterium]|nr:MAG: hypothetical protein E2P02_31375 [Acidobacteriota bacterium]